MNKIIYASDYAKLDSNVYTGGGTDETEILQSLLDKATEYGSLKLVMDGAALIHGLKIHSNTTIECLNKSCGFYLADNSDCAVLMNSNPTYSEDKRTKNIYLNGGTYNHNCLHQQHDIFLNENIDGVVVEELKRHWTVAMEFIGVENFTARDLVVRDQRTFAFTVGNFSHVTIENVYFELENEIPCGNQDGFHFWGPGQFLTVKNVGGKTQDDFMNIGPDERDGVSSITDVVVDGVFLDHAWQGIRLLSHGTGLLDRVSVRNVTGVYGAFGFYINPWFIEKTNGNFGNILFENIDVRPEENPYKNTDCHHPTFLFSIGGDMESITFRNINWYHALDNRNIFQIGYPYHDWVCPFVCKPVIKNLCIDGLKIIEEQGTDNDTEYMLARGVIERFTLQNVDVVRPNKDKDNACLMRTLPDCEIKKLKVHNADIENISTVFDFKEGKVDKVLISDVFTAGVNEFLQKDGNTSVYGAVKNLDEKQE